MLGAFNVYRTETLLEVLDRPRTIVFLDGVVLEGEARVEPRPIPLDRDQGPLRHGNP